MYPGIEFEDHLAIHETTPCHNVFLNCDNFAFSLDDKRQNVTEPRLNIIPGFLRSMSLYVSNKTSIWQFEISTTSTNYRPQAK